MAKRDPDVLIWIVEKTLTDGSTVYNVEIPEIAIAATTEDDAEALAEELMDAINEHSAMLADIVRE